MSNYPKGNLELIEQNRNSKIASGIKTINNNLNKNVAKIQSDITGLSKKYKQLRNDLTLNNEKQKRQTEEYIANTGNHTASGFAMSKRLDNTNAFNKEMNNINLKEQSEKSALNDKIRDAYTDADTERNKLITEENDKALERSLEENKRLDNLYETKRMNDASIFKINSDVKLSEAKDKREQGEYELDMKYGDEMKQAELGNIYADTAYTEAKTNTEVARKSLVEAQTVKAQNTSSGSSSRSGSGSGSKDSDLSDMTPAKLAENINKQTGTSKYDPTGKHYYEVNPMKAYTMLMEWKKKFNLSAQVVNDTAIYLGIQAFL